MEEEKEPDPTVLKPGKSPGPKKDLTFRCFPSHTLSTRKLPSTVPEKPVRTKTKVKAERENDRV